MILKWEIANYIKHLSSLRVVLPRNEDEEKRKTNTGHHPPMTRSVIVIDLTNFSNPNTQYGHFVLPLLP